MLMRAAKDVRYGFRSIIAAPVASLTIVLSLAVGMGVATTAFSILNAMVLSDLPGVVDQRRLVTFGLSFKEGERQVRLGYFSLPDLEVLLGHPELFQEVAAGGPMQMAVEAGAGAEFVAGEVVTANYFRTLGARPALGRLFEAEEEDVVVLSHRFWLRRFSGDPHVLDRTVDVNGRPLRVVGVTEKGFTGMAPEDVVEGSRIPLAVWVPMSVAPAVHPPWAKPDPLGLQAMWLRPVARLAEGVSRERLAAALPILAGELARAHPESRVEADIVHGDLVFGPGAGPWRPSLTVLGFMVVPFLVLLVACANAVTLLLARNTARRRDLGVKKALGAGRGDLVRQLLVESGLLALAAGLGGLLVALGAGRVASLFSLHLSMDVTLDWRVFTFALVCSLFTGLALGLVPALRATGEEAGGVLYGGCRSLSVTRRDSRLRDRLVVAQVAVGLVLMVASGLFVRSARHGLTVDSGMDEDRLLLLSLDLDLLGYEEPEGAAFHHRLVGALESAPGVERVAMAARPPLEGAPSMRMAPAEADEAYGALVSVASVGSGLLEAVGIELLAGRTFSGADLDGGAGVVVVNRAAAELLWPGEMPLGRALRLQDGGRVVEVVGIVANSRISLYRQAEPLVYLPFGVYAPQFTLHVRTSGKPAESVETVREVVRGLDHRLPVRELAPAVEIRRRLLEPWRLASLALGVLGGLAVALAGAGLNGVMAYAVTRRTREIGVRMALGAHPLAVARLVVAGALRLTFKGLAAGFIVATALSTLLRGAFFGVSPLDPWVYGQVAGLLLCVGVVAALVPAVRGASVDPVRSMTRD